MKGADSFAAMVAVVDRQMAAFYGFSPQASAADHLIDENQLALALGAQTPPPGRAAVFVNSGADDELFIGVHFTTPLVEGLVEHDPTQLLGDHNLDGFCHLIEEISHFHLLLNRAAVGRSVSKLELEGQGEIDKLLFAAMFLEQQCGDSHLVPLARRLYDGAHIVAQDYELYWQATRYAARFWYALFHASSEPRRIDGKLRQLLRLQYDRAWSAKLDALPSVGQHAA